MLYILPMGVCSCLLLLPKVIVSRLPWITQWALKCASHQMESKKPFLIYSTLQHSPAAITAAVFWLIFVPFHRTPSQSEPKGRASLPIEAVSSTLVAVSGTVTGAAAVLSEAPVAHETSVTVGPCHAWLAVAESCLGVASPAPAEGCVG